MNNNIKSQFFWTMIFLQKNKKTGKFFLEKNRNIYYNKNMILERSKNKNGTFQKSGTFQKK